MTSQSMSRTEYILNTDNVMALDWYFNFTEKSNVICSRLYYDLVRCYDNLYVAYFFNRPVL